MPQQTASLWHAADGINIDPSTATTVQDTGHLRLGRPVSYDPDADFDTNASDTDWSPSFGNIGGERDLKGGEDDTYVIVGRESENELSATLPQSPDAMDIDDAGSRVPGARLQTTCIRQKQTIRSARKVYLKVKQRQMTLMSRGIGRTLDLNASNMPLGYLDSLISQTDDAAYSRKYKGYAIHETCDATGKRLYHFLDPKTAMNVAGGVHQLIEVRTRTTFDFPDLIKDQEPIRQYSTRSTGHPLAISGVATSPRMEAGDGLDAEFDLGPDIEDPDWLAFMDGVDRELGLGSNHDQAPHIATARRNVSAGRINAERKRFATIRQRQVTLMTRGIRRTPAACPSDMPLTLLDKLVTFTENSDPDEYAGYAIHMSRAADGKRIYSFLDPQAAIRVGETTLPLLATPSAPAVETHLEDAHPGTTTFSRPVSSRGSKQSRGARRDRREDRERRLRRLAKAYFILEARGVRRTSQFPTQRAPPIYVEGVIAHIDLLSVDPLSEEPECSGLVLHNTAVSRHACHPVLLDWRERVGLEGGGRSESLLLPWMEKYR